MRLSKLLNEYDKQLSTYLNSDKQEEKDMILDHLAGLEKEIRQAVDEYFEAHKIY